MRLSDGGAQSGTIRHVALLNDTGVRREPVERTVVIHVGQPARVRRCRLQRSAGFR
jgi:hypothetical protein